MTPRSSGRTTEKNTSSLNRTARRRRRTRENLIAAVRKLTAEKGVDALTIRDIAEAADIAMGSFYNYFESKEELLSEAVEEIIFQSGEIIDSINATSSDPLEIIATAFTTFDGIIQNDPILGWFIVRVSAHNPQLTETMYQRFVRDVNQGVESGQFNIPDVPLAVDLVGSSLLAFYRARLMGRADENSVPDFVHMMLRLLGAEENEAKTTAHRIWNSISKTRKEVID